jgi:hypothetical protein
MNRKPWRLTPILAAGGVWWVYNQCTRERLPSLEDLEDPETAAAGPLWLTIEGETP